MLDYDQIGATIRKMRKLKNLTQEQLAEQVDISCYHLRNIENANARIGLCTLVKIANVLDVSTDVILRGSLENQKRSKQTEYYDLIEQCDEEQLDIVSHVLRSLLECIK